MGVVGLVGKELGIRGGGGGAVADVHEAGALAAGVGERSGGGTILIESSGIGFEVETGVVGEGGGFVVAVEDGGRGGGGRGPDTRDVAVSGSEGLGGVKVKIKVLEHPAVAILKFGDPVFFAVAGVGELFGGAGGGVLADRGTNVLHKGEFGEAADLGGVGDDGDDDGAGVGVRSEVVGDVGAKGEGVGVAGGRGGGGGGDGVGTGGNGLVGGGVGVRSGERVRVSGETSGGEGVAPGVGAEGVRSGVGSDGGDGGGGGGGGGGRRGGCGRGCVGGGGGF